MNDEAFWKYTLILCGIGLILASFGAGYFLHKEKLAACFWIYVIVMSSTIGSVAIMSTVTNKP